MKRNKVSFDFDGTIEFESVKEYAKYLVEIGIDVHIVTARHHCFYLDVLEVADYIKIPHFNVIFTNGREKSDYFKRNKDFIFHLDDDLTTTRLINERTKVKGVTNWANPMWKEECEELIFK